MLIRGSTPTDSKNLTSSTQSLPSSLKNSTTPTTEDLQKFLTTLYASSTDVTYITSPEALLTSLLTNAAASASKDSISGKKPNMLEAQNASSSTPLPTNGVKPKKPKISKPTSNDKANAENHQNGNGEAPTKRKVQSRVSKKRKADPTLPEKQEEPEVASRQERPASELSGSSPVNEGFEIDDIESFAHYFKKQRVKLGFTQGDVGAALGKRWGADFSQTTISRFEALNLSFKNMCKLRPLLRDWIVEAEKALANGATVAEILGNPSESTINSSKACVFYSCVHLGNALGHHFSTKISAFTHFLNKTYELNRLRRSISMPYMPCNALRRSSSMPCLPCNALRRSISMSRMPCNVLRRSISMPYMSCNALRRSISMPSMPCNALFSELMFMDSSIFNSCLFDSFSCNSRVSMSQVSSPLYTSTPNFVTPTSNPHYFLSQIEKLPFIDDMVSNFSKTSSVIDLTLMSKDYEFPWFSHGHARTTQKKSKLSSWFRRLRKRFHSKNISKISRSDPESGNRSACIEAKTEIWEKLPFYALGVLQNPNHPVNKVRRKWEQQILDTADANKNDVQGNNESNEQQENEEEGDEALLVFGELEQLKSFYMVRKEEEDDDDQSDNGADEDDPDAYNWDNFQWNGQEKPSNTDIGFEDMPRTFWNCEIWNNNKYNSGLTWRGLGSTLAFSMTKKNDEIDDVGGNFTPWNETIWNSPQTGMLLAFTLDEILDEFQLFSAEDETDMNVIASGDITEI